MIWLGIISVAIFLLLAVATDTYPQWFKGKAWIAASVILANIGLLVYAAAKNFLISIALWMAEVTFIALWRVLRVIGMPGGSGNIKALALDNNVLKNSKKALTNGAAILSVISCYTTANGMQDVVFGGWLAYPASIAVQVTLAFLSFFLLRFILTVRTLQWSEVIKRAVSYVLIFIAIGYLTISSLFSYSFIVTKAYEKTKDENNEAITRSYFTKTANLLEKENKQRGTRLYSEMSDAINDSTGLAQAIQVQQDSDKQQLNTQILMSLAGVSNISVATTFETDSDFSDMGDLEARPLLQTAQKTLIGYNDILQGIKDDLALALVNLKQCLQKDAQTLSLADYQTINESYSTLYGSNGNSKQETIDDVSHKLAQIPNVNSALRGHIQSTQTAIVSLNSKFKDLNVYLEKANDIIEQNDLLTWQSILSGTNSASIQKAEDILKAINEIQIKAETVNTQEEAKNDIDDLLQNIGTWTASQNLAAETVEKIRRFCEYLKEYRKYIELKQTIEKFNRDAVKKVYVVVSSEKDETNVGDISYVTKTKWMAARNEDFYTLENSITLLPEDINTENDQTENSSEEINSEIMEIPSKAIRMQRVLFAELTDVERAINYFGEEYTGYRNMAVFSVVMALFFDLGAFIMGNLAMLIEYIEKEKA